MRSLILTVITVFAFASCSDSGADPDTGKVAGVLRGRTGRDATTEVSLPNATIRIEPGGKVLTTGPFGEYTFVRPTSQDISMEAWAAGFDTLRLCLPRIETSRTVEMGFVVMPKTLSTRITSAAAELVSANADSAVVRVSGLSPSHELLSVAVIAADVPPPDTAFHTAPLRTYVADGTTGTLQVRIKGSGSGLYVVVAPGRSYLAEPWFCGSLATGLGPITTFKVR